MTNKQDEGMTIEKAREMVKKMDGVPGTDSYEEYDFASGFIEGWDARGLVDAEIVGEVLDDLQGDWDEDDSRTKETQREINVAEKILEEILKLQSEGEK